MDPEVHSENSSDYNSDSDEPEERQMNQIDLEVAAAKRHFDRIEARALTAATARNRADINAMLSVQSMQRRARAAELARGAPFADTSPPVLMAAFRRRCALAALRELPKKKAVLEQELTEDELELELRRIDGNETFAELWPKLAKNGWSNKKGHGLISWLYLRPGAVLGGESGPVTSSVSEGFKKAPASFRHQHPHWFNDAPSLLEFVRSTGLDGVSKTGHLDENLPLLYSAKPGPRTPLGGKSSDSSGGGANGKRSGKLVSKYEPDVSKQWKAAEEAHERVTQDDPDASSSDGEAQVTASVASPLGNVIPMEASRGWGSSVLFGYGVALGTDQNGSTGAPGGGRSLRMQSRGISTMERVNLMPQTLSIAPLAAEGSGESADANVAGAEGTDTLATQAIKYRRNSKKWKPETSETALHALEALPMATSWVSLKRNVRTQDQKALEYTPYFGDHDASQEKLFGDLFDFEEKQRAIDAGPPAEAHFRAQRFQRFRQLVVATLGRAVHAGRINDLPGLGDGASAFSFSSPTSGFPSATTGGGSKVKGSKGACKPIAAAACVAKQAAADDDGEVLLAECAKALADALADVAEGALKVMLLPEDFVTADELRAAVQAAAAAALETRADGVPGGSSSCSSNSIDSASNGTSKGASNRANGASKGASIGASNGFSVKAAAKKDLPKNALPSPASPADACPACRGRKRAHTCCKYIPGGTPKLNVFAATAEVVSAKVAPALPAPPPPIFGAPASEPEAQEERYLEALDSYRHLMCRFCFCYDCNLHRDYGGNHAPAQLAVQTAHALAAEPYLAALPLPPFAATAAHAALSLQEDASAGPPMSSASSLSSLQVSYFSPLASPSSSSSSSSRAVPLTFAAHSSAAARERTVLAALSRAWVAFGGLLAPTAAALGLSPSEAERLLDLAGLPIARPHAESDESAGEVTGEGVVCPSTGEGAREDALSASSGASDQPSSPRGGPSSGGRGGGRSGGNGRGGRGGATTKRKASSASNNNRAYHLHQRQGRSGTVVTASSPYLPCTHAGKCSSGGGYHKSKGPGKQQQKDAAAAVAARAAAGSTGAVVAPASDVVSAEPTSSEEPLSPLSTGASSAAAASHDSTCECLREQHWCTKFCICAPVNLQQQPLGSKSTANFSAKIKPVNPCPNFFSGCHCKMGHCNTKQCACFVAGRECDPDLCRDCGACAVPGLQPAPGQNCRNDNLSMGRHTRLLLARSLVPDAGWGLFTLHAVPKGDFVHEYVGEVVSQDEAERRGRVYDKINRSYLFNLNADFCIDAARKGNKMRFANHSSWPNLEPRVMFVNGEHRIAMYARDDIGAQSELFFDYGYDTEIKSAHLHKQAIHAEWMVDGSMANKISACVGRTMLEGGDGSQLPQHLKPLVKGAKQQRQQQQQQREAAAAETEDEDEVEKKRRFVKSSAYSMFLRDTAVRKEVAALIAERTVQAQAGGSRRKRQSGGGGGNDEGASSCKDGRAQQFAESSQGMAARWAAMVAEGMTGLYVAQADAHNKKRLRDFLREEKDAAKHAKST